MKTNRRNLLAGIGAIAPLRYFSSKASAATASSAAQTAATTDYFADLGIRSFINAVGPYSSLGGAQMRPEVIEAMAYAVKHKARMSDLHDAVGNRIAELLGAESAMVTAGATCAIMLGTAACMTMGDPEKMARIPDASGMPNEVLILQGQRYLYDRSIRAPGTTLVVVETAADVRAAINPKTAMLFYLQNQPEGQSIEVSEYIAIAQEHGIPIMCDAATTVPPVGRMKTTVKAGFDLICYSGGKGLRGPYSAGLLLGRADLIRYARMNGAPNHRAYGRSMKVAPEEYLGMMVAVEVSLEVDEEAEFQRQLGLVTQMGEEISRIPGVNTVMHINESEARQPYVEVHWDEAQYKISIPEMKERLRRGEPSVEISALFLSNGQIRLSADMLKEGEAEIVSKRVREVLSASA